MRLALVALDGIKEPLFLFFLFYSDPRVWGEVVMEGDQGFHSRFGKGKVDRTREVKELMELGTSMESLGANGKQSLMDLDDWMRERKQEKGSDVAEKVAVAMKASKEIYRTAFVWAL
ncbi:hypothetical protein Syun_003543 [Stephania yunnanensis]|uniref:Uncharacterized protein n=1 Tax=Stephania yunnanensis TaxID=152371 RepID=A0AAP0Q401_9MAGN